MRQKTIKAPGPTAMSYVPGEDGYDLDACRDLFFAIIELAIRDVKFIKRVEDKSEEERTDYERRTVEKVTEEGDPTEFFQTEWFEVICKFLDVHPDVVRNRLPTPGLGGDRQQAAA